MNVKTLTENISVSAQIDQRDVLRIAKLGFRTIVNNRPDREVPIQLHSYKLAQHAKLVGIKYFYVPVISGGITEQNLADFSGILRGNEGPILAFCRTGTRSANLWAIANPDNLTPEEIKLIGVQTGYSL